MSDDISLRIELGSYDEHFSLQVGGLSVRFSDDMLSSNERMIATVVSMLGHIENDVHATMVEQMARAIVTACETRKTIQREKAT